MKKIRKIFFASPIDFDFLFWDSKKKMDEKIC